MPEGHSIRHYADMHEKAFANTRVATLSPQGRFSDGAAKLNNQLFTGVSAHGKHLFLHFEEDILHIHLGLYGSFTWRRGPSFESPKETARLRISNEMFASDLSGPTACEIIDDAGRQSKVSKLGPDPIHDNANPDDAWVKVHKSSKTIGELLMDQSIIAGIGNVYRAELLFLSNTSPFVPGKYVPQEVFADIWANSVRLLRLGAKDGRINTVSPEHLQGEEVDLHGRMQYNYVYKRTGRGCVVCGTAISTAPLAGRTVYWCETCQ